MLRTPSPNSGVWLRPGGPEPLREASRTPRGREPGVPLGLCGRRPHRQTGRAPEPDLAPWRSLGCLPASPRTRPHRTADVHAVAGCSQTRAGSALSQGPGAGPSGAWAHGRGRVPKGSGVRLRTPEQDAAGAQIPFRSCTQTRPRLAKGLAQSAAPQTRTQVSSHPGGLAQCQPHKYISSLHQPSLPEGPILVESKPALLCSLQALFCPEPPPLTPPVYETQDLVAPAVSFPLCLHLIT